jgi:hypothetical protein
MFIMTKPVLDSQPEVLECTEAWEVREVGVRRASWDKAVGAAAAAEAEIEAEAAAETGAIDETLENLPERAFWL